YGTLVESARALIENRRASKRNLFSRIGRWLALDLLFSNLGWVRLAATLLRIYQRSGLQRLMRATGVLRLLHLSETEAFAPAIPSRYFVPRDQRYEAAAARFTVMLHVGCVMHVAFTPVHEATVRVLKHNCCTVVVPATQGCCGAIAVHAGEPRLTEELAKKNIAAFEQSGADYYIVNAAGCGSTLKEYGELLSGDPRWSERAAAFSSRVRDVLEFLDEIGIDSRLGALDVTVTYQEPCHLAHAQRIAAAPRRLMSKIPALRIIEMAESSVCCGSAGIYNLTEPEMSRRLRDRKIANIVNTQAGIVATGNPGCAMQVAAGLSAAAYSAPVKHVVELLDASYSNYSLATKRSRSSSAALTEA
ncbi:MAG TPA: (Fe-S)-binding protein, partial [Candidatus Rubrimentiphilum sp.]|nr:(Fe-S)-binding protein [Candidatus Rubrimentiphilum sp.]